MTAGPYAIGSAFWPGLSKANEEAGEVVQRVGKIMGCGGARFHFDGSDNLLELVNELADAQAAIRYAIDALPDVDRDLFEERAHEKLALFWRWHHEARGTT